MEGSIPPSVSPGSSRSASPCPESPSSLTPAPDKSPQVPLRGQGQLQRRKAKGTSTSAKGLPRVLGKNGPKGIFSAPPRKGRRFKGVRRRRWGRWVSEIRDAIGKRVWLGCYDSEERAARAYDTAARVLQGETAWLNFPGVIVSVELPGGTLERLVEHRSNLKARMGRPEAGSAGSTAEISLADADESDPAVDAQVAENSTEDPPVGVGVQGTGTPQNQSGHSSPDVQWEAFLREISTQVHPDGADMESEMQEPEAPDSAPGNSADPRKLALTALPDLQGTPTPAATPAQWHPSAPQATAAPFLVPVPGVPAPELNALEVLWHPRAHLAAPMLVSQSEPQFDRPYNQPPAFREGGERAADFGSSGQQNAGVGAEAILRALAQVAQRVQEMHYSQARGDLTAPGANPSAHATRAASGDLPCQAAAALGRGQVAMEASPLRGSTAGMYQGTQAAPGPWQSGTGVFALERPVSQHVCTCTHQASARNGLVRLQQTILPRLRELDTMLSHLKHTYTV